VTEGETDHALARANIWQNHWLGTFPARRRPPYQIEDRLAICAGGCASCVPSPLKATGQISLGTRSEAISAEHRIESQWPVVNQRQQGAPRSIGSEAQLIGCPFGLVNSLPCRLPAANTLLNNKSASLLELS
jgi:hypothetical protein